MSSNDTIDAWGQPLKMMCGMYMPRGAKGIAVMSMGADGKEGTEDDIIPGSERATPPGTKRWLPWGAWIQYCDVSALGAILLPNP